MSFSVSAPSYVYHCPSGYFFRLCIPKFLKVLVGKTEFRYSRTTGIKVIARQRDCVIVYYINLLFGEVCVGMPGLTT